MVKSIVTALVLVAATTRGAGAGQAAPVQLSFSDGRVTIVAADVPVSAVFDEWARTGGTEVVGADRLAPRRVTLNLTDVAEDEALAQIVGKGQGFAGTLKSGMAKGASRYRRLVVGSMGSAAPQPVQDSSVIPELKYTYSVPLNAKPADAPTEAPRIQTEEELRTPPEVRYEYTRPLRAGVSDPPPPPPAGVEPLNMRELPEPEKWIQYTTPRNAKLPEPDKDGRMPAPYVAQPSNDPPPPAPETVFQYHKPLNAILPEEQDSRPPQAEPAAPAPPARSPEETPAVSDPAPPVPAAVDGATNLTSDPKAGTPKAPASKNKKPSKTPPPARKKPGTTTSSF